MGVCLQCSEITSSRIRTEVDVKEDSLEKKMKYMEKTTSLLENICSIKESPQEKKILKIQESDNIKESSELKENYLLKKKVKHTHTTLEVIDTSIEKKKEPSTKEEPKIEVKQLYLEIYGFDNPGKRSFICNVCEKEYNDIINQSQNEYRKIYNYKTWNIEVIFKIHLEDKGNTQFAVSENKDTLYIIMFDSCNYNSFKQCIDFIKENFSEGSKAIIFLVENKVDIKRSCLIKRNVIKNICENYNCIHKQISTQNNFGISSLMENFFTYTEKI